jgi:inward rectifier potassium channel
MNGVPTLAFRIGNDRASTIFEAIVRVSLIRTERTAEGVVFYRLVDLVLSRERSPALARSWTVMHPITPESPLFGMSPTSCKLQEVELVATVVGTDDTSLQPVHARHRYVAADLVWGARLADVLRELPDGRLELDVRKFDELTPSEKTEAFPYGA